VAHHNDPQLIEANRRHDAPFSHPDFWDNRWRRKRGWLQAGGTEHGCDPTNEEGVAGLVRRK
jgi:hypothetical protein